MVRERKKRGAKKKRRFSQCSDDQTSTAREEKLNHASRATRGVPKSWSFVKLQKVGNFPTWITSSLKAI